MSTKVVVRNIEYVPIKLDESVLYRWGVVSPWAAFIAAQNKAVPLKDGRAKPFKLCALDFVKGFFVDDVVHSWLYDMPSEYRGIACESIGSDGVGSMRADLVVYLMLEASRMVRGYRDKFMEIIPELEALGFIISKEDVATLKELLQNIFSQLNALGEEEMALCSNTVLEKLRVVRKPFTPPEDVFTIFKECVEKLSSKAVHTVTADRLKDLEQIITKYYLPSKSFLAE